ncbi:MAG: membrane protein insertase YidC [Gammaproteobacteria bacterium]|nr:membrane protein insertase YidC [Gammaproteobacteria bacterium]
MDNLRLILVFTLAFIVLLLWQAWNEDYGPKPEQETAVTQSEIGSGNPAASPPAIPSAEVAKPESVGKQLTGTLPGVDDSMGTVSGKIGVTTDLFTLEIDTRGGSILSLLLNEYPVSLEQKDVKFTLMRPTSPDLFVAQSGLIGLEKGEAPTHEAQYQSKEQHYSMGDKDSLVVDLSWTSPKGIQVTKRFTFTRGSYLVKVEHRIDNPTEAVWSGREYRQLMRGLPGEKPAGSKFLYTYTGGAIYTPEEKYEKISFEKMEEKPLSIEAKGGWFGMLQHYFIGAWIPPADETDHFYTNVLPGQRYVLGAYTPSISVAPGGSHTFTTGFVAGPKLQDKLEAITPGLELTVDYGWLTVVAKPIFWLLKAIHKLLGNWGWSIIVLTLIIKLLFFKLSETSYKSMANMRKMTPRIQALKDRYGDDKQRLNQAMMEMYKKEKINPLGGCLPIVVQIPVFIALYWVLLESVELRQAPWIFWIRDLSIKDQYYVLPLIMGISMFIQQKLNPAPPDPMQAKIMMALPFVFTVFFAFFPSGLVLYWVTNNILSISQQWVITRQIEKAT